MILWTEPTVMKYQLVELFSGEGCVSAAFRAQGKTVLSFDRELGGAAMDMCGDAGFLPEPRVWVEVLLPFRPSQGLQSGRVCVQEILAYVTRYVTVQDLLLWSSWRRLVRVGVALHVGQLTGRDCVLKGYRMTSCVMRI